ncbi:DUF4275 family protein [Cytobacillus sp. FSL R5-0569]|uniref:DUF4275 family protein n=1 Tax=Cytobacillus sp. FSL R5-0569 TaxID=2921649 RepID=UPI0027D8029F|nr:DUF4275 family protein [Cytobacillus kochii]
MEIPKWGTYLRKQWEDNFVNHLSDKEKKSIYLYEDGCCGYLWHVFSYEKRKYLKEEQADTAFKKEPKQACYVFYQDLDDAYILENASSLTAEDFVNEEDVYVVDKEFNWTYVRTHETGWCGPYFSRKDKTN